MYSKAPQQADSRLRAFQAAAICCAAFAALALCACASSDPAIAEVAARRLLIQDEAGGFSAHLSVFALFTGGGEDFDFSLMTVTHDETGVFWEAPASRALAFNAGNDYFWVGSSRLAPLPSILIKDDEDAAPWGAEGFFPKGAYTVAVDNAAGSGATASFALAAPFYFAEQPATFGFTGEGDDARWNVVISQELSPREAAVYLFLLDEGGNPLSSIRITLERFRGRRAEGRVRELLQSVASKREEVPPPAAVCCYVEHAPSSSAVLLFPLNLSMINAK